MEDLLSKFEQIFGWVPQWAIGLGLVVGAIFIALFVYGIVARIIRRVVSVRWPAVKLLLATDRRTGSAGAVSGGRGAGAAAGRG
ncbi:hypothetical protein [Bradyrhizobium paxllaeri]|uniref:hypothetical protein n=1 Tax=Bradyrhizobium paxllaeri TaxID=190148 RepID=UPI00081083A8|nr:hypothetical protein [Bradyrhizobium paxllaeri]